MKDFSRRVLLRYLAGAAGFVSASLTPGCAVLNEHPPFSFLPPTTSTSDGSFDVVVYGGTPSGMIAAVAAARIGARVAIVEQTKHVGGILTSGLGITDSSNHDIIGGLVSKFYFDIGSFYGLSRPKYAFEPHVAEIVFNSYLKWYDITLYAQTYISAIIKDGTRIESINLNTGATIRGDQWIDATYEGDLMTLAGVTYAVGRESSSQYQESYAGWGSTSIFPASPFTANGSLIPGVNSNPIETPGQGDRKIMAYTFRSCLTNNPSNLVPFPRPTGYSTDQFSGLAESIQGCSKFTDAVILQPTTNSKFCLLRNGFFSTDYAGASWDYPESDWSGRAQIFQRHLTYVMGLLYFLANDPAVPPGVRSDAQTYGLAADEFIDNSNWPWQMYVREGRRMVGQYVMTQKDLTNNVFKPDSIAIGLWPIDSHWCDLYASQQDGRSVIAADGQLFVPISTAYELPLRAILPQETETSNLAVTVCMSASHVAFSSIRVEPTLMSLGEAAGYAAGIASQRNIDLMETRVQELQKELSRNGAKIHLS